MNRRDSEYTREFLAQAKHSLGRYHLPRILRCLQLLSDSDIWWRPNTASNSVGNLVLHLEGNVRQWILSGLGGTPDRRQRDREFAERGPLGRHILAARLEKAVKEACRVIGKLPPRDLARTRRIQKFRVTAFEAIHHVTEHFAFHTGQIIYVTKLRRGRDLGFTRLPGQTRRRRAGRRLPAI